MSKVQQTFIELSGRPNYPMLLATTAAEGSRPAVSWIIRVPALRTIRLVTVPGTTRRHVSATVGTAGRFVVGAETAAIAFEPIDQLRAHEYVAEQLRRQIGLHIIPVGGALPTDRDLSAMFGVGRATVQAAIRLLEAERLVETRRGRKGGTFVIRHADDGIAKDYLLVRLRRDQARIREALVFRGNVDPFAATLAAKHRTKAGMEQIHNAHERAAAAATDTEFMTHDTEFHLAIARAADNSFVYEAVERARLVLNDALAALPESKMWQRRTTQEHATVLQAIENRDAAAAGGSMARHAESTKKSISALLAAL